MIVLILITVFLFAIPAFLFFLYSFVQVPKNAIEFVNSPGFDAKALLWEDENTMQITLNKFFDGIKIGKDENAGGRYQNIVD